MFHGEMTDAFTQAIANAEAIALSAQADMKGCRLLLLSYGYKVQL